MASQDSSLPNELQQHIEAFQKDLEAQAPGMLPKFQAETAKIVATGIADHSLRAGDTAPDFALPNVRGETVSLAQSLARGPAVVAFYRGVW